MLHISSKIIAVAPTLDTNAYASGDRMGSIMEFSGAVRHAGGQGMIESLVVLDKGDQALAFDIMFFDQLPTVASSDNDALSITDAEMEKYLGHIVVASADFKDMGGNQVATYKSLGLLIRNAKSKANDPDKTSIWAICVAREAQTRAATDLKFRLGVIHH